MSDELDVVRRFIEAIDKLTPAQRKDMLRELRQRARDEVMPPPEPKWLKVYCGPMGGSWIGLRREDELTEEQADQAAAVLNAYEQHGAVLRVRPWQEALDDDETPVLRWSGKRWVWSTGKFVRHCRSPWAAMPPEPGEVSDG